jgi:hypothetical protein
MGVRRKGEGEDLVRKFLLLLVVGALLLSADAPAAPARASAPRCGAEDGPGWVWTKCGNRKRGVRDWNGRLRVVTKRTFCRVVIDWSRTPQLPGDPSC